MRLTVIDLETTGLSASGDRIIEVAIVRSDGEREVEAWSSLVRSDVAVGASERVHGISNEMLRSAPSLASLAPRIAELVQGATLVAHRAPFDLAFLAASGLLAVGTAAIDTAAIADRVFGESGLASLAGRIGGRAPSHRALPDALAALDLLRACIETLGDIDAAELVALSGTRASMRAEVEQRLRSAMGRAEPLGIVYRTASGRAREEQLVVESLTPPYATGMLLRNNVRRTLRGDRIVRAWLGARPAMRFLDRDPPSAALVEVGGSRS